MPEFFDYNPQTGITTYFDYDEQEGIASLHKVQDIQPFLEHAKALRLAEVGKAQLKKDDYGVLHAIIPPVVEMALLKKGIKISDPNCTNELLKEIEQNYPYLKCTDMVHLA